MQLSRFLLFTFLPCCCCCVVNKAASSDELRQAGKLALRPEAIYSLQRVGQKKLQTFNPTRAHQTPTFYASNIIRAPAHGTCNPRIKQVFRVGNLKRYYSKQSRWCLKFPFFVISVIYHLPRVILSCIDAMSSVKVFSPPVCTCPHLIWRMGHVPADSWSSCNAAKQLTAAFVYLDRYYPMIMQMEQNWWERLTGRLCWLCRMSHAPFISRNFFSPLFVSLARANDFRTAWRQYKSSQKRR